MQATSKSMQESNVTGECWLAIFGFIVLFFFIFAFVFNLLRM